MNSFTILPNSSWYTNPATNRRKTGIFLSKSVSGFYHSDYHGGISELRKEIGTVENIVTTLKNQFRDRNIKELARVQNNLIDILKDDLPKILNKTGQNNLTVCVIPRSKAETSYYSDQLLFKQGVIAAISQLNGFIDGSGFIVRHTDTRTTHLDRSGYGGSGDTPYPGITIKTCTISDHVKGRNILLIDDLYTESVNIDEDAIQALLAKGANTVVFYSLGKTAPRTQ